MIAVVTTSVEFTTHTAPSWIWALIASAQLALLLAGGSLGVFLWLKLRKRPEPR